MTQRRAAKPAAKPVEPQPVELVLAFDNRGELIMFQPLPAVVLRNMAQALIRKADGAMVPATNGHQPVKEIPNEIEQPA